MARPRSSYVCGACGGQQPKWSGQCPDCGGWNTLSEQAAAAVVSSSGRGARVGYAGTVASRVQSAAEVDMHGSNSDETTFQIRSRMRFRRIIERRLAGPNTL